MYEVKRYHCAFCTKALSKKAMEQHEKRCPHNPASKSCVTCVNFRDAKCEIGKIDRADATLRNPDALKSGCPFHRTKNI